MTMRFFFLSIWLLCLIATGFSEKGGKSKRIVGGIETLPGRFPYMCALIEGGEQFCGGTLIDETWVLTAAHCAGFGTHVMCGRSDLSSMTEYFEKIPILYEVMHPSYNRNTNEHDMLLVKLSRPSSLNPVKVDDGTDAIVTGREVTVMGWGTTCYGGPQSDKLLEVQVDVLDQGFCNRQYSGSVTTDMICAARPGKDACQGDSGGPLVIKGISPNQDLQVGVVSWGNGCAEEKFPGVYSRTSAHYEWIESTTSGTRIFTAKDRIEYSLFHYSRVMIRNWKKARRKKNGLRYFVNV